MKGLPIRKRRAKINPGSNLIIPGFKCDIKL
jgi:hypothetical protein